MPDDENTNPETPGSGEGGDNPATEGGGTQEPATEGSGTDTPSQEGGGESGGTNQGETQMTTTEITVKNPVMDRKQSYEIATEAAASAVAISTDMVIKDAMKNKNNSMTIFLDVPTTGGTLLIKAGDNYPNACLGDATLSITAGYTVIQLEDISRFENRDGSIKLVGDGTLAGNILVSGKRVGVDTVAGQNARDYNEGRTLHYDPSYTG